MGKGLRRAGFVVATLLVVLTLFGAGFAAWYVQRLRASLPRLDGEIQVAGLAEPVEVARDALGVPTISAGDPVDLARALGLLHGQERFFQMDLSRRSAAGELAELFGAAALPTDRARRLHGFRPLAHEVLSAVSVVEQARVIAYAEGVNAGLAALGAPPPEYVLLRTLPEPWLPEDSYLTVLAMYLDLQGGTGGWESTVGLLHDLYPPEVARFLTPIGSEWDAPLIGEPFSTPPIPGPEVVDLSGSAPTPTEDPDEIDPSTHPGSNNWAVGGAFTAHGGALLANDMHLGLSMPNIWYRASLIWRESEQDHRATGVTLPGVPGLLAGSTGRVAWGFTNSYGDWIDLVIVEVDPENPNRYRTESGWREFGRRVERISVAGATEDLHEVTETIWGPVIDHDHRGRPRALRWVAHEPEAINLELFELSVARDVEEAIEIAHRSGIPAQNLVAADSSGAVGWTLAGRVPRRVGFDGRTPVSWADGTRRWDGWLPSRAIPQVVDPPEGRIGTGNNRAVDGAGLRRLGDGGFASGARAGQIRDGLLDLEEATEEDLLRIQLDDRARFLDRWRDLLLDVLSPRSVVSDLGRQELRRQVAGSWTGHASIDSVGYRMVRAFRLNLAESVFDTILAPCRDADPEFGFRRLRRWEGPLWALVQQQPPHLLPPEYASWNEQFLAAADKVIDLFVEQEGAADLAGKTWGDRNAVRIQHPLSRAIPQLAGWLDIPVQSLPGDSAMPRVQSIRFGASQRMVVSPGREESGLFHMPGGQSGHPLSPYYRRGHDDWAEGRPSEFLPGPPVHRLTLRPLVE